MAQLSSTVVTPNISSSPGYSPHPSLDASHLVPAVVMSISFLLGFPGNIAVIILKPNWENMSSLSQSLMLNLAVSDLLCLVTLPLWIYSFINSWAFGLVSCKLITYFVYCSVYASLLTVTVLSVQRYLQVVHRQGSLHQVKARKLLVPLWLIAMILSIPTLVVREQVKAQHRIYCKPRYSSEGHRVAVVLTGFLVSFVTFSVMAFAYISLYRRVNRAVFFNNPHTTRLLTSIVVAVFVLWVPYRTMNVVELAAVSLKKELLMKFCEDTWNAFASVTFVNSTVNPLLYVFTSNHLSTLCKKSAQHLMQKLRISQTLSKSTDTHV